MLIPLHNNFPILIFFRCNDTRYDTRCYFNVRSKADISQLIYRTEPTTKKCKTEKKLKSKKNGICSEVTVNSLGNPCRPSKSWRRKGKAVSLVRTDTCVKTFGFLFNTLGKFALEISFRFLEKLRCFIQCGFVFHNHGLRGSASPVLDR